MEVGEIVVCRVSPHRGHAIELTERDEENEYWSCSCGKSWKTAFDPEGLLGTDQRKTAELYYWFVKDYPDMGPIRSHVVYTHVQNRVQNDLDVTYTSVIDEIKKKYPTWHW